MSEYLSSGSALERAMICGASVALPHAHFESEYTERGSAIHSFLEAVSSVGRDAALEQTDPEWREACAELELEGLHSQLTLASEVALAYNVVTDTARELGRGKGRAYDDVGIDEIPCTLDVVGVRPVSNILRGLYVEWKSGFTTRRSIGLVTQIDFGALCVARAFGCDVVEGQLVHISEDHPYVQRKVIEAWELDAFAAELRERHREWKRLREMFLKREVFAMQWETGPWCARCPAREWCDAQTHQIRALLDRDTFDGESRTDLATLPDAALASLWDRIPLAQDQLSFIKGKILGLASSRKIFLGMTPDGRERWLGPVLTEGNDKLDGEKVFDVIAELHGEEVATKATTVVATKKSVDAAIKDATKRGQKAKALDEIYSRLKKAGGITNKISMPTKEIAVKPSGDLLPPALEAGIGDLDPSPDRFHDPEKDA